MAYGSLVKGLAPRALASAALVWAVVGSSTDEGDELCALQLSRQTTAALGCCFLVSPLKIEPAAMTKDECFQNGDFDSRGWTATCPKSEGEALAAAQPAPAPSPPQKLAPGVHQRLGEDAGVCGPRVVNVEDFEGGEWPYDAWTNLPSGSPSLVQPGHTGTYALNPDGDWYYSNFAVVGIGYSVEAWVFGSGGRAYLGFDSSENGTSTFVVSWNTGDIRFQENPLYDYVEVAKTSFSPPANVWLRMKATIVSQTQVTGELFDAAGALLASVNGTGNVSGTGTVAFRGFGGNIIDDISTSRSSEGDLCRPARGNCDEPEYCSNNECPPDEFKPFGTTCNRERCASKQSVCLGWCPECRR